MGGGWGGGQPFQLPLFDFLFQFKLQSVNNVSVHCLFFLTGMFRSSTRPEVASIQPVNEESRGCSRKAVLQALSTQPSRLTSIILAEDIGKIHTLRASIDIIVGDIGCECAFK